MFPVSRASTAWAVVRLSDARAPPATPRAALTWAKDAAATVHPAAESSGKDVPLASMNSCRAGVAK
jgi:hypothetical protein